MLKYPLLLLAISEETPDGHPDKEGLDLARKKMEEVARNVNEGRRRAEVVKEVLSSKKKPLSAAVNLGKMRSLRVGSSKLPPAADADNEEAAKVEKMHMELKRIDAFVQHFARNVLEWSRGMGNVVVALRVWATSFGKVIGLSADQGSEAFDAFMAVVEEQLIPLCIGLEAAVNEKLLKEIAHLLTTMTQPFKLIACMNEQEPLYNLLFTMNLNNRRPPPNLVEASNNYRALRGQLAAELPEYLFLMNKGLSILIRRLVEIQVEFWRAVRDRWGELWDMLRVDGEMNAGSSETIKVWRMRWAEVDEVVSSIGITQRRKLHAETLVRSRASTHSSGDSPHSKRTSPTTSNVSNILSTLDPVHIPPSSPTKTRPRGSSDASARSPRHQRVGRKSSNESLRTTIQKPPKSPRRRTDDLSEYVFTHHPNTQQLPTVSPNPPLPRTKSMPLPIGKAIPGRSHSSSRNAATSFASTDSDQTLYYPDSNGSPEYHKHKHDHHHDPDRRHHHHHHHHDHDHERDRDRNRGRSSRKSSLKRKEEQGRISIETIEVEDNKSSKRQNSAKRSSASRQLADSFKNFTSLLSSGFSTASSTSTAVSDESWLLANVSHQDPRPLTESQRDSWMSKDAKYACRVIHACRPPASVAYFSFPFFTLVEGDLYEILQEAGHPSIHPKLPLYVDDGEDCLLLCRDAEQNVGWALASFLEPLDILSHDDRI